MSSFVVTTKQFEGPIDVLLQMIEKRKMPINDISLADITDDYIQFVQGYQDDSLSSKTHFIFVASTLILIKSKSLLPSLDLTDEEEEDIELLKLRILLLRQYQSCASVLKHTFHTNPQFYYPRESKKKIRFIPHTEMTTKNLQASLELLFNELPEKEIKKKEGYIKIAVHIEEMMDSLEKRMKQMIASDFDTFIKQESGGARDQRELRVYKVVGFLAMLELVKGGIIEVLQEENFNTITIEQI